MPENEKPYRVQFTRAELEAISEALGEMPDDGVEAPGWTAMLKVDAALHRRKTQ